VLVDAQGPERPRAGLKNLLASDLSLGGCVVTPTFEGGPELDRGDEERAGLTDGLEVAAQLDGAAQ
jgi:hypothetical protein